MIEFENTMEELTISDRRKLFEFAEYLRNKTNKNKKSKSFKLDWVGDLKELSSEFTSVELQHKILDNWTK